MLTSISSNVLHKLYLQVSIVIATEGEESAGSSNNLLRFESGP